MTILAIGSVLFGAVFGRFFKVWVLVPAFAVTAAIAFISSTYHGHGLLAALFEFAMLASCLQIGFACGLLSCVIPGTGRRLSAHAAPRQLRHLR